MHGCIKGTPFCFAEGISFPFGALAIKRFVLARLAPVHHDVTAKGG